MLKLTKPIVFLDLETTSEKPHEARIVEICLIKIHPDGRRDTRTRLVNPGVLIPQDATDIHGITDDMVSGHPAFKQLARSVVAFLSGCDLGSFNGEDYDVPVLMEELARCGVDLPLDFVHVDVFALFRYLEPRSLTAAVRKYLGRNHEGAHGAEADTLATIDVLLAMLQGPVMEIVEEAEGKGIELGPINNPESIVGMIRGDKATSERIDPAGKMVRTPEGLIVWNFGKNKGLPVVGTDPGFVSWLLNSDFPDTTKRAVKQVLNGSIV